MSDDLQPNAGDSQGLLEMPHLNGSDDIIPSSSFETSQTDSLWQIDWQQRGFTVCCDTSSRRNALAGPVLKLMVLQHGSCHANCVLTIAYLFSRASACLQDVQNPPASSQTLIKFTVPVVGVPQLLPVDLNQYDPPQPSQEPLQGHAWSSNGYPAGYYAYGSNIPGSHYGGLARLTIQRPKALLLLTKLRKGWQTPACTTPAGGVPHSNGRYPQYWATSSPGTYPLRPSAVIQASLQGHTSGFEFSMDIMLICTARITPTRHSPQGRNIQLQTRSSSNTKSDPSSSTLDGTASAKSHKRKACQPVKVEVGSSSSSLLRNLVR
ncbi:hypothetical protein BDR03DRAFT_1011218 [Suillus americanus]|nr:hypothetical protein BDR03DRAFT_1011218 [Suillus americanus]